MRRVMAFLAPCEKAKPAPEAAAPFGFDPSCHSLSDEAMRRRLRVVKGLQKQAKDLLAAAHAAFLEGDSAPADRVAVHAIEDWYERLVCEEERLEHDLRTFDPTKLAGLGQDGAGAGKDGSSAAADQSKRPQM